MKKLILTSLFASATAVAFADSLYYVGSGAYNVLTNWKDADGNPATHLPDANTDVFFDGVAVIGSPFTSDTVKSITFDNATNTNSPIMPIPNNLTVLGDITYSASNAILTTFYSDDKSATINGKIVVSSSGTSSAWFGFSGLKTTKLMGDITVKNGVELKDARSTLNFQSASVNISNKVKMNGSLLYLMRASRLGDTFTSNFSLDGLEGTGSLGIGSSTYSGSESSTVIVNMIFTNSTNSEFVGTSKSAKWAAEFSNISADSKVNIEMNAAVADAKQTLRLSKGYAANVADNVAVKNGFLNLYGNDTFANLTVSGGKFSSAAAKTPSASAFDIGTTTFTGAEWSGGTILAEIADATTFDKIVSSGVFNKSGDGILTLELSFDATAMQALIDASESKSITFADMITYAGTNIQNADVVVDGVDGFNYAVDFGSTGMSLTISAVPEPAEWAAIFGAVALTIAAWRRRK